MLGLNLGLVGGGAAAGLMAEHFGWRFGFWVLGGLGLVLAGILDAISLATASPDAGSPPSAENQQPGVAIEAWAYCLEGAVLLLHARERHGGGRRFLDFPELAAALFPRTTAMKLARRRLAGRGALQAARLPRHRRRRLALRQSGVQRNVRAARPDQGALVHPERALPFHLRRVRLPSAPGRVHDGYLLRHPRHRNAQRTSAHLRSRSRPTIARRRSASSTPAARPRAASVCCSPASSRRISASAPFSAPPPSSTSSPAALMLLAYWTLPRARHGTRPPARESSNAARTAALGRRIRSADFNTHEERKNHDIETTPLTRITRSGPLIDCSRCRSPPPASTASAGRPARQRHVQARDQRTGWRDALRFR